MYRNINDGQFSIYDFILPFGGHLKEDNRWVQLRKMIDWQMIDEEYSRHFKNKCAGQEASLVYSFFEVVFSFALSIRKQHKNNVISGAWTAV